MFFEYMVCMMRRGVLEGLVWRHGGNRVGVKRRSPRCIGYRKILYVSVTVTYIWTTVGVRIKKTENTTCKDLDTDQATV